MSIAIDHPRGKAPRPPGTRLAQHQADRHRRRVLLARDFDASARYRGIRAEVVDLERLLAERRVALDEAITVSQRADAALPMGTESTE